MGELNLNGMFDMLDDLGDYDVKVQLRTDPYRGETLFALNERREFLLGELRQLDDRIRHRTALVVMCNAEPSWLDKLLRRLGWWLIGRGQVTFNPKSRHCYRDAGYLCNSMNTSICEIEHESEVRRDEKKRANEDAVRSDD